MYSLNEGYVIRLLPDFRLSSNFLAIRVCFSFHVGVLLVAMDSGSRTTHITFQDWAKNDKKQHDMAAGGGLSGGPLIKRDLSGRRQF